MLKLPSLVTLNWDNCFRLITSKFLPINLFEKLVSPDQMEDIYYLEGLTNDRLREEVGEISFIRPEDRICGEGSSVVMAAFTHISKPSRFTDGTYGVYYASKTLETAVFETVYWRERFLSYTNEKAGDIDMRVYVGKILKPLHDVRDPSYQELHHPDPEQYTSSQAFALKLREQNSYGLVYNSVRDPGGECIAAFRPTAISIPKQTKHLTYVWNGNKITTVYEKKEILFEL